MRKNVLIETLIVAAIMSGCGGIAENSKELTREKAAKLIQTLPAWTTGATGSINYNETTKEAQCLVDAQLIKITSFGFGINHNYALTPAGEQIIDKIVFYEGYEKKLVKVWFKHPPKLGPPQITGITGTPTEKNVEFTAPWDWGGVGLPPQTIQCADAKDPHKPITIAFRLYDDGWRVAQNK